MQASTIVANLVKGLLFLSKNAKWIFLSAKMVKYLYFSKISFIVTDVESSTDKERVKKNQGSHGEPAKIAKGLRTKNVLGQFVVFLRKVFFYYPPRCQPSCEFPGCKGTGCQ